MSKMQVAAETFRWQQAYGVNIAVLDEQHKKLIGAVNELDQALRDARGNSALESVLQKLIDYTAEHFATEEGLMARYDFPGLPMHHVQHEEFRQKLAEFLDAQRSGKSCVPVALMLFLQTWLKEHLIRSDKLYSAYLNARGVY